MTKINKTFPVGRIIKVLRATNFISVKAAAVRIKITPETLRKIELEPKATPLYETIDKIATAFQLPIFFLEELNYLETKLEEDLNKQANITVEEKERLILQALAYKVLEYYLTPINLPLNLKYDKIPNTNTSKKPPNKDYSRIIKVLLSTNFISFKTLAKESRVSLNTTYKINRSETNPTNKTLTKIAKSLNLSLKIIYSLKELEIDLEKYLEQCSDIDEENQKLIILQALSHALLDYYFNESAETQNLVKATKR